MERKYYVYEHREADTGRTFYVGKGFGRRFNRRCDRSDYWRKIVNKHSFTYHVLYEGLTECEALRLEVELIAAYGRENLCNLTDGGEGVSNPSAKARMWQALGQASKDSYTFYHDYHGEFTGTTFELRLKYGLTKVDGANLRAMVATGRYLSVKGWRMTPDESPPRNQYIPQPKDKTIYTFYHDDLGVFIGDRLSCVDATNLFYPQVSNLVNAKRESVKGWTVDIPRSARNG